MNKALQLWNNFWFAQISPASVCLFRIFYGLIAIATGLVWLVHFSEYFSTHGWLSIDTAQKILPSPRFSILYWLPPSDASAWVMFIVYMVSATFVTMGLFTRISSVCLFLCMVSLHFRDVVVLNGADTILRVAGFLLIFSPAGKMFSLDAKFFSKTDQWSIVDYCWVQRLLQLEISAIYFQTFITKLAGSDWRSGHALYYVSKMESYLKFPIPLLFDQLWICCLFSWLTLVVECLLFSVIWIPRWRYPVLVAGVLLHLGIDWYLNIQFFEWVMIALFINFVRAEDIQRCFQTNVESNELEPRC